MKTKILILVIFALAVCLSVTLYEFAQYRRNEKVFIKSEKGTVVGVPKGKAATFTVNAVRDTAILDNR